MPRVASAGLTESKGEMKSDEVIAAEAALIKCAISAEAPVPFAKASSTNTVEGLPGVACYTDIMVT